MSQNTIATSTQTMPTPEMRSYLEANPGWADEPFTRLFQAGFSLEEFAYLTNLAKVQHHAGDTVNARVQEWLAARPDAQRFPVTDIIKAGFTKTEQAYVVDYLKDQIVKTDAARLAAETLIVPADGSKAWDDKSFHVIATIGKPRHASEVSPTDPERRQLNVLSLNQSGPVQTANIGDTWTHESEDGESWTFEYLGKFRVIGKFEDTDTERDQYVIREVSA